MNEMVSRHREDCYEILQGSSCLIMLQQLKMHGMAQSVGELTEQGSPAFETAIPILSQLLKA